MKIATLIIGILALLSLPAMATDIQVPLEWDANQEADLWGYEVYQAEILGATTTAFVRVGAVQAPATALTVTVDDVKNWRWVVYAVDNAGNRSLCSNTKDLRDQIAPANPQNLR